jgi:hypothetical protein
VPAVAELEVAHAADAVAGQAVLDMTLGDQRVPLGVAVEIARQRPDPVDRKVYEAADIDFRHEVPR